jgi:hypothetical protein
VGLRCPSGPLPRNVSASALLVQDGIRLPSNLQGLYEVRYKGEQLDGEATLRLLEAFNEFRNYGVVPGQPNVTYFAESKPSASIDRVEWLQDAK